MSQPERQERITETLALLGRLTPAALPVDRDELFFRAGEASARGEQAVSSLRRFAWPAIAATLALTAASLGYSIANREPEVQIVYVERPEGRRVGSAHQSVDNLPIVEESNSAPESRDWPVVSHSMQARFSLSHGARGDLIHPQDWAALSDAFAQQLRLQHERSEVLASFRTTGAEHNDQSAVSDKSAKHPRTYLELRDAMQTM